MAATAAIPSPTVSGIAAKRLILLENLGARIFSDGMEVDFFEFNSGTHVTIAIADQKAYLVVP